MDKIGLVSSSKVVADDLAFQLGPLVDGRACTRVTNLGANYTAGRALRAPGARRSAKLKQRAAAAYWKAKRLKTL
eukprot:731386-Pyramimonas_sp.AAC.1